MRRSVLIALAVAAVLSPARVASAGTLSNQERDCYDGSHFCETTTLFRAAPGERNVISVSGGSAGVIVRDAGAELLAGKGCLSLDAHAARCPAPDLDLALGDGDDTFAPAAYAGSVVVDGGASDDVITGGVGRDRLQGDDGADTLAGGPGDDFLTGGAGRDTVDGGDGRDRVSFFGGPPVLVDLAAPGPDGPPSEPDALLGVEDVVGSEGADTLRGDGGANLLDGQAGDDTISGEAGSDVLYGGTGFDRLTGGTGDDELATDDENAGTERQPGGERADCGDGTDLVSEQAHDILSGCERLELPLGIAAPEFDPRVVLGGRTAALRLRCSTKLRFGAGAGCRVRVTLSARGTDSPGARSASRARTPCASRSATSRPSARCGSNSVTSATLRNRIEPRPSTSTARLGRDSQRCCKRPSARDTWGH